MAQVSMVWGGSSDPPSLVTLGGVDGNAGWLPLGVDPTVLVTTQSGTSYTFALADAGSQVLFSNGSAVTATVPPNSSVAFPIGTTIDIEQAGAGQVTIAAGSNVTIRHAAATLKMNAQYSVARIRKTASDTWVASGDLAAS